MPLTRKRSFRRKSTKGRFRSAKRRRFSRKSGTLKRTFKRRGHRSHKRHKRGLSRIGIRRVPMNVIPRTADRARIVFDYKLRANLFWAATAERHIGFAILPCTIGVNSVNVGPFQDAWPASGTNVTFAKAVSTTIGFLTMATRYQKYYVSGHSISIKVIRQNVPVTDTSTVEIGMMPLTQNQFVSMVSRNTALSPLSNNNVWLPGNTYTSTTVATQATYDSVILVTKQQPYVKYGMLSVPYAGRQTRTLKQWVSAKKFTDMGFPMGDQFSGLLPVVSGTDATPPASQFYHYFWMHDQSGGAGIGDETFDVEITLKIHMTLHRPGFLQVAPTLTSDDDPPPELIDVDMCDSDGTHGQSAVAFSPGLSAAMHNISIAPAVSAPLPPTPPPLTKVCPVSLLKARSLRP